MNGILSQYMMRTILASTALVLVVLLALAGLFEFIAELDDTRGDYQTPRVILYTLLRLPQLAVERLPVAALIGSLLGLGALAANSEIIVMRSAGLSIRSETHWTARGRSFPASGIRLNETPRASLPDNR